MNGFRAPVERGLDETITGLFLQLNGRGRTCAARKATTHGATPFVNSPALLQSAALGEAVRCHPNPGLARSSRHPGLTPAGRWPTTPPRSASVVRLLQKSSTRWAARVPSTAHGILMHRRMPLPHQRCEGLSPGQDGEAIAALGSRKHHRFRKGRAPTVRGRVCAAR
jgi:hypothetical protein